MTLFPHIVGSMPFHFFLGHPVYMLNEILDLLYFMVSNYHFKPALWFFYDANQIYKLRGDESLENNLTWFALFYWKLPKYHENCIFLFFIQILRKDALTGLWCKLWHMYCLQNFQEKAFIPVLSDAVHIGQQVTGWYHIAKVHFLSKIWKKEGKNTTWRILSWGW